MLLPAPHNDQTCLTGSGQPRPQLGSAWYARQYTDGRVTTSGMQPLALKAPAQLGAPNESVFIGPGNASMNLMTHGQCYACLLLFVGRSRISLCGTLAHPASLRSTLPPRAQPAHHVRTCLHHPPRAAPPYRTCICCRRCMSSCARSSPDPPASALPSLPPLAGAGPAWPPWPALPPRSPRSLLCSLSCASGEQAVRMYGCRLTHLFFKKVKKVAITHKQFPNPKNLFTFYFKPSNPQSALFTLGIFSLRMKMGGGLRRPPARIPIVQDP